MSQAELPPASPGIRIAASASEVRDAAHARVIAEREAEGFKILDIRVVPGMPIIMIENPFADTAAPQLVELPYETPAEEAMVHEARAEYQRLMDLHGSENVLAVKPSLEMALQLGHMFPDDLVAFMVRAEPLA